MNGHQQVRLHNQTRARFLLSGVRHGLSIGLLVVFIMSVMIAWFGFLGWGLIEFLRSLIGLVKYLW